MVIVLLYVAYLLGGLEWAGFVQGTALILFWVALFYVMLRTGLNLKFRDASMTVPQLASSLMTMAFVMYYADRGRAALLIVFLVVVPVRRLPPADAPAAVPGVHGDRVVRR